MPALNPFDLTGHVSLITGGNSGIGLGFAEGLALAGSNIAIWGTNEEKNAAAVEHIEQLGVKAVAFKCDVGEEADVEAAFVATIEAMGKVDSCFANSGISGVAKSFLYMSADEWHRVLRVNLDGVFFTLRERRVTWLRVARAVRLWSPRRLRQSKAKRGASITQQPRVASFP